MRRRAFTLIELLVVIAVVGVLLAILAPALTSARASAMRVIGQSNIRQLAVANLAYSEDRDDRFAPAASGIATTNLHRWHGTRDSVGGAFDPREGELTPYLGSDSASGAVRECPRFAPVLDELERAGVGFERGYGYNAAFVGAERTRAANGVWRVARDDVGSRASRFRRPSETVMFADAALATGSGVGGPWGPVTEYSFAEPPRWPQFLIDASPDPSIHFRHDGRANVAWLDGHVSAETRASTSWSGLYPQDPGPAGLGWFGPGDANTLFDYE